jgi:hypothetical protein
MRAALLGTADAALAPRSITQIATMPDVNTRMECSHKNGRGEAAYGLCRLDFICFRIWRWWDFPPRFDPFVGPQPRARQSVGFLDCLAI